MKDICSINFDPSTGLAKITSYDYQPIDSLRQIIVSIYKQYQLNKQKAHPNGKIE